MMLRRLEPGTAGTLGFLLRLMVFVLVVLVALRIAGLQASTLAAGGAFTAVIVGLAAQQTLGNLVAGLVLQTTRPFRAGERVRLINGMFAGPLEGVVSQPGLIHTTMYVGSDRMVVPNREILAAAIVPLKEPERVDMQVRFPVTIGPKQLQGMLDNEIDTDLRYPTDVVLEGLDKSEVLMRVRATPSSAADGGKLAEEIIEIVRKHGTSALPSAPQSGFESDALSRGNGNGRVPEAAGSHAGDGLL
jgi:small-conductance mechanosensitive channel